MGAQGGIGKGAEAGTEAGVEAGVEREQRGRRSGSSAGAEEDSEPVQSRGAERDALHLQEPLLPRFLLDAGLQLLALLLRLLLCVEPGC